ncbi:MAG: hypothetical protein AAF074_26265 [Pseudomonadota bacterium]
MNDHMPVPPEGSARQPDRLMIDAHLARGVESLQFADRPASSAF